MRHRHAHHGAALPATAPGDDACGPRRRVTSKHKAHLSVRVWARLRGCPRKREMLRKKIATGGAEAYRSSMVSIGRVSSLRAKPSARVAQRAEKTQHFAYFNTKLSPNIQMETKCAPHYVLRKLYYDTMIMTMVLLEAPSLCQRNCYFCSLRDLTSNITAPVGILEHDSPLENFFRWSHVWHSKCMMAAIIWSEFVTYANGQIPASELQI